MEKFTKDFVKSDFLKSQNLSFFKSHLRVFGTMIPRKIFFPIFFWSKIFFEKNIFFLKKYFKKYFLKKQKIFLGKNIFLGIVGPNALKWL